MDQTLLIKVHYLKEYMYTRAKNTMVTKSRYVITSTGNLQEITYKQNGQVLVQEITYKLNQPNDIFSLKILQHILNGFTYVVIFNVNMFCPGMSNWISKCHCTLVVFHYKCWISG